MKRTELKSRSKKRSTFMRDTRAPAVAAMVEDGTRCAIGPRLEMAGISGICVGQVSGLHERRKRSSGGSLVNPLNLIPACTPCNGWVEDRLPILLGDDLERWEGLRRWLVVREGDSEWNELGSRTDRIRGAT